MKRVECFQSIFCLSNFSTFHLRTKASASASASHLPAWSEPRRHRRTRRASRSCSTRKSCSTLPEISRAERTEKDSRHLRQSTSSDGGVSWQADAHETEEHCEGSQEGSVDEFRLCFSSRQAVFILASLCGKMACGSFHITCTRRRQCNKD